MEALKLWGQYPERTFEEFKGAVLSCEVAPTLLGVGYIIGPRIAAVTFAGGVLAYLVMTPTISLFGSGNPDADLPGDQADRRHVGQGDPRRLHPLHRRRGGGGGRDHQPDPGVAADPRLDPLGPGRPRPVGPGSGVAGAGRTERDLPIWVVGAGSTALVAAIAASGLFPGEVGPAGRVAGAAMIALFGFLFVTVSSRLTGEIGSSSNPISGMTVATLLLTCLIFVLLGWVGPEYRVAAVSIAGIVCVAASNGGTTSQDLKTGYLIGATPRSQQLAILVGALTSAVVIGSTLLVLNQAEHRRDEEGRVPAHRQAPDPAS